MPFPNSFGFHRAQQQSVFNYSPYEKSFNPSWDRIVTILKNETLCVNELARRIGLERPHMIEAAKDPRRESVPNWPRIHYASRRTASNGFARGWASPGHAREAHPQASEYRCRGAGIASYRALLERRPPRPGAWLPGEIFEPGVVVGFRPGRSADRYESYLKVATVPYAFDRPRGWLLHEGRPVLVDKLTRSNWSFSTGRTWGRAPSCVSYSKGGVRLAPGRAKDPAAATGIAAAGLPAFRSSEIRPYGAFVPVRPDGQRIRSVRREASGSRSPWR